MVKVDATIRTSPNIDSVLYYARFSQPEVGTPKGARKGSKGEGEPRRRQ